MTKHSIHEQLESELSSLRFTERMCQAVRERAALPEHQPKRRLGRGAVAMLAACCILIIAAGAAAVLVPVLQRYYGGAGYTQGGASVGRSITVDGWTMTLTDCVGDEQYLCLGFELTAPAGTVLDAEEYHLGSYDYLFLDAGEKGMASRHMQIKSSDAPANQLHFMLWIEGWGEQSPNGQEMRLSVEGLYHAGPWDEKTLRSEDVYDFTGTWDFGAFPLSYPDNILRLSPKVTVDVLDVQARVVDVSVSPIGVCVTIEGDALKGHHKKYNNGYCISLPEITLYNKDGSTPEPDKYLTPFGVRGGSGCSGGSGTDESGRLRLVQSYGYLLDLDALDHITVCGVDILLD